MSASSGTAQAQSNPTFGARLTENQVHAHEWLLDVSITLTVDDPANGPGIDYTDTQTATAAPWNPQSTFVRFDLGQNFHLQAHQLITLTDGITTKTHTVTGLTVTAADPATDTVSGTAEAGSDVWVSACDNNGCVDRHEVADGDGNWVADFAHPGNEDWETGTYDIGPGSGGDAKQGDEDGDGTQYGWYVPNPFVEVSVGSRWAHAREWPTGALITMTVDDPDSGPGVDFTATATMGQAPWNPGDPNDIVADFNLGSFELQPGQVVTMTDGVTPKTLTLSQLAITSIAPATDIISGIGTPGVQTQVCANVPNRCITRWVTPDASGNWTANYAVAGVSPDDPETVDLQPGSNGWAAEYEADRDRTWADWRAPNPYLEANPDYNWAHAREWPISTTVSLSISGSGGDYTTSAVVEHNPWNPGDPNDIRADFDLQGYDLQPGDVLTATGNGTSKTLTLSGLAVAGIDVDTDTVTGTADANARLHVWACDSNHCANRNPIADGDGNWTANFSIPEPNGEQNTFDLVRGTNGGVQQFDEDNDMTHVDWRVLNPNFAVWPVDDRVEGWEWPIGATVTVTIDNDSDPDNGALYTDSQPVIVAPWDSRQTYFNFNLWGVVNIQPGHVITVTDGATVKTHVVQALTYDSMNYDTNIGAGTASPNASLQVSVGGPGFSYTYDITADANGNWTMDYGAQGVDVAPQNWVNAQINDDDGDRTQAAPWGGGQPRINASLEFDWINISGFMPNRQVTYTIYDYEGGHALFGPVTGPVDPYGNGNLNFHRIDLIPGNVITAKDEYSGVVKSLTMREIKFEVLDTNADVARGFADPNVAVRLNISEQFNYGYSIDTTTDGNGNWSVNLRSLGYDLSSYWWATANLVDDDGDEVVAEAPRIEADVVTDHLSIHHFRRNASVTVEISDEPGGIVIFGPLTLPTDRMGEAWLNGRDHNFDLVVGQYIMVTDNTLGYTKELLVEPVTFDELNFDQDYASGTADVGRRMTIHINGPFSHYQLNPLVNASRNWLADFGGVGYDLTDIMWGTAWVQDGNMDVTYANTTPPPNLNASAQYDWINGYNFTPNGEVQVDVYDSTNTGLTSMQFAAANAGPTLIYSGIHIADGNTNLWVDLRQYGIDLQPGYFVVATDLISSHATDLTLVPLTFDNVDYEANIASGTAEPGARVTVHANRPFEHYELTVTADNNGQWAADFNPLGVDLTDDMSLSAQVYDESGDATQADAPKPPTISASITTDDIWGNNWTPDADVEIALYASASGALLHPPLTAHVDSYGNFGLNVWGNVDLDLQAGNTIVVTDLSNGRSKDLTLANLTFDYADYDNDVAGGTAPADTRIRVGFGNNQTYNEFDFFSESNGAWVADFGAHWVNITPDMSGNARLWDDDGDSTQADWLVANPSFSVRLNEHEIHGYSWPLGVSVTVFIDDPATQRNPDYTEAQTPVVAPWNSRETWTQFRYGDAIEVQVGFIVTMTNGVITREHVVTGLTITAVDTEADTVSGTAAPGSEVWVDAWGQNGVGRREITDASGNWTANFAAPGNDPKDYGFFDIKPGDSGEARQHDQAGNNTQRGWYLPNPALTAFPEFEMVEGWEWPDGSVVHLTIDDPATAQSPDFERDGTMAVTTWGDPRTYVRFDFADDYNLKVGDIVTVSDGVTPRTHVVLNLSVTGVDAATDTITGRADPDAVVNVWPHGHGEVATETTTGEDGIWLINYTGLFDLAPGSAGRSQILDAEGNATAVDWSIRNPFLIAFPENEAVEGWEWPDGNVVHLTIDDPTTTQSPDFERDGTMAVTTWGDPRTYIRFDFAGEYDLKVGDVVTISDGVTPRTHVVLNLSVTEVDAATDAITGQADPGATVVVWPHEFDQVATVQTTAGKDGKWLAGFAGLFDLVPGTGGRSQILDEAGNATAVDWQAPTSPIISARPYERQVTSYNWPDGAFITLTIDDPATPASPDYTATTTAVMQYFGQTEAMFDLRGVFTVEAGQIVTMTDGATTKTHIVTNLAITAVEADTDQVIGVADPGDTISIFVWASQDNATAGRDVTADDNGIWVADFSIPVNGMTYDIVDGTWGETWENDDDFDNTNVYWNTPFVPFCQLGATVTGIAAGPDGERITDATIHFDDFNTGQALFITYADVDGAYSCRLPDGDYRIWANGSGYSREYYDETIYENATLIHVTTGVEYANVNFTLDTPSVTYDHLTFNMTDPVVGDLAVRQAIAFGTDRARIIAATYPYSPMLDSYLTPDHWAHASDLPQYSYNPMLAAQILTDAGWVDTDGDGVREKEGVRLHVDYYTTWAALRATVSQIFVENMADIGVEVEVFALSPGILFASDGPLFGTHEFGIAQFAWGVDVNDDANFHGEIFNSQLEDNVGLYSNPDADRLLAQGQAVGTRAEKLLYWQQHQVLVMTDLAILPLFERIESPPPVANAGPDQTAAEGEIVTLSGEGSSNATAYHWEVVDATGPTIMLSEADTATPNFTAFDDGVYTFRLTVTDGAGRSASDEVVVTVSNVAPTLGVINAPASPLAVNTVATISVTFNDPGVLDTHTAQIDWDDSSSSAGEVNEADGSGVIDASHTYTSPGVYTVKVAVSDDDGGSKKVEYQYVVVFDPSGSFVTGGGWINSPAGAYTLDPGLTGKATFGFVAKYQKGAIVPKGETEFKFGDMKFKSTVYDWLVVSGAKAQFKGAGTINGLGDYGFMITAIDGQINASGGADKLRIKIWDKATEAIVYDNLMGAVDTANPTTVIGGGSIVIHK